MKIKKCWYIGVDGEVRRMSELEGKELALSDMYKTIGCDMIEHVGLKKGVDMWIDEEGLLKNDWILNTKATKMYQEAFKDAVFPPVSELAIVGNAIITDNTKAGDYIK